MRYANLILILLLSALPMCAQQVPSISYCDMMKNRQQYVGKKISVYADIKVAYQNIGWGDMIKPDAGGEYLYDATCDGEKAKSLRTGGSVGIGFEEGAEAKPLWEHLAKLRDDSYAGRARVQATGVLREEPGDLDYLYLYRFDVERFDKFERLVLPFQGQLEQGWIYSDTFVYDADDWVIKLSQPIKRPNDDPVRILWKNEKEFPALATSGRKHIVFRVILRTTDGRGPKASETVYFCEILELK